MHPPLLNDFNCCCNISCISIGRKQRLKCQVICIIAVRSDDLHKCSHKHAPPFRMI
uniref:Uncharacterized protein n=1 Tax=Arundo donax TaxID=35708 RepID=A0A0A9HFC3_ARUDO